MQSLWKNRLPLVIGLSLSLGFSGCGNESQTEAGAPAQQVEELRSVTFGVSPFQDTYLPVLGEILGLYEARGLDVEFEVLGWTEVMEALSSGDVDVAINNMTSVIGTHGNNSEIIYWYGFNTFDNGFALMVRPDAGFRTIDDFMGEGISRDEAIQRVAAQLAGRTVISAGATDMEQGAAAAAERGGVAWSEVNDVDLSPDEGLAAFLRGDGEAYVGGVPQRTEAGSQGMIELLTGADLGPPPINGLVTTKTFASTREEDLLAILDVWFEIVEFVNADVEQAGAILLEDMNARTTTSLTVSDFVRFWNNYEHYPPTPAAIEEEILSPEGGNYWMARWADTNNYFLNIIDVEKGRIQEPVSAESAFWMERAHEAYVASYGSR